MKYEVVDSATAPAKPKRLTAEQIEADIAVRAMRETGRTLAIEVEPEAEERTMRLRLARAGSRAGVKVESWYDPETAKVYARLKA